MCKLNQLCCLHSLYGGDTVLIRDYYWSCKLLALPLPQPPFVLMIEEESLIMSKMYTICKVVLVVHLTPSRRGAVCSAGSEQFQVLASVLVEGTEEVCFWWWGKPEHQEETRVSTENMQTLHREALPQRDSNPGPCLLETTVSTTASPCCPKTNGDSSLDICAEEMVRNSDPAEPFIPNA